MEIRSTFCDRFVCLADRCRHSCCRGWEIEVDEETARRYRSMDGALGDELRAQLQREGDIWSLRLTEREDCPFLRTDGLCRLILELGEDALCDVCALHPRFFENVGEYELSGVGMSCEAAAALLLHNDGPLIFLTEDDEPLTLPDLLRVLGHETPEERLRFSPVIDGAYYRAILERYARCEAIDAAWTDDLARLAAAADLMDTARAYIKQYDRAAYDRMFGYLLFRQLERLPEYGLERLLRFAREATDFIFPWDARTGDTAECLRRWSAEMEYSTENVERLLAD